LRGAYAHKEAFLVPLLELRHQGRHLDVAHHSIVLDADRRDVAEILMEAHPVVVPVRLRDACLAAHPACLVLVLPVRDEPEIFALKVERQRGAEHLALAGHPAHQTVSVRHLHQEPRLPDAVPSERQRGGLESQSGYLGVAELKVRLVSLLPEPLVPQLSAEPLQVSLLLVPRHQQAQSRGEPLLQVPPSESVLVLEPPLGLRVLRLAQALGEEQQVRLV
jgi:hypothetical protein